MKLILSTLSLLLLFCSCRPEPSYDLAITHARVLDIKTGKVSAAKTILVRNGIIEAIFVGTGSFKAAQTIDAAGKLVSPGFIDTHIHPTDIFGDYDAAPALLPKNSGRILRQQLSDAYLPFGTTTVMTMGQPENWLPELLNWQQQPQPEQVTLYIAGGALISKENRTSYIGHTEVATPEQARQKVIAYHDMGISHVKFYFRLKEPEFTAALHTADSLHMKTYGHIGDITPGYLTIGTTLAAGLTNYEHIATIPNSILTSDADWALLEQQFRQHFGPLRGEARLLEFFLEQFRFIKEHKAAAMEQFINTLAQKKATFSTTIHRLYEQIGNTYLSGRKDTTLNEAQLKRCLENFAIMMTYARQMNNRGIELRLGSDMANGGRVNISELMILARYGFSIADIFRISAYNGAKALGIDKENGALEKGKKADLIIWDKNPFDSYLHFSSEMTVVKNGKQIASNPVQK